MRDNIVRIFLILALGFYLIDGPDPYKSFVGFAQWLSIMIALTAINIDTFLIIIKAIHQIFADIGDILLRWASSAYLFILRPLERRYKAREDNYKEIVKRLQKELSEH